MRRVGPLAISALFLTAAAGFGQSPSAGSDVGGSALESYIEILRQQAGIPGISGVLVQDGEVVWERGLGMANQEARIRATPDTPYLIADLSQALSAILVLRCAEMRRIDLDAPLAASGAAEGVEPGVTVRQALSHAAPAAAGGYRYDPAQYARLTPVIERCEEASYRRSLTRRLLEPLAMIGSVPGRDLHGADFMPADLFDPATLDRYAAVLNRLAVPYRVERRRATRTELPVEGVNAATGVVSTARDLARLDIALDAGDLLRAETLGAAWSPAAGPAGATLPTGLGWFVQSYRGTTVIWQFGAVPNAYSALIVKVPSRKVTMILLANSDGLTGPFQLEGGDVTRSIFAAVFLRLLL